MQRFKAVETAHIQGSWQVARHQEAIHSAQATLTPASELSLVARAETRAAQLRKALEDARSRRPVQE